MVASRLRNEGIDAVVFVPGRVADLVAIQFSHGSRVMVRRTSSRSRRRCSPHGVAPTAPAPASTTPSSRTRRSRPTTIPTSATAPVSDPRPARAGADVPWCPSSCESCPATEARAVASPDRGHPGRGRVDRATRAIAGLSPTRPGRARPPRRDRGRLVAVVVAPDAAMPLGIARSRRAGRPRSEWPRRGRHRCRPAELRRRGGADLRRGAGRRRPRRPAGPSSATAPSSDRPGPRRPASVGTLRPMRAFRRGLIVVFVAAVAGAVVRLRGKGGVPPTSGGWRELEAPDFR